MNKPRRKKFWADMFERYGKRWTDLYGENCTDAWGELLDRFEPHEVKAAISGLTSANAEFCPTLPQFEFLLAKASKGRAEPGRNYRRDFWRSVIVDDMRILMGYSFTDFERIIVANKDGLGSSMLECLNDFDAEEARAGDRPHSMERRCKARCWTITAIYSHLVTPSGIFQRLGTDFLEAE